MFNRSRRWPLGIAVLSVCFLATGCLGVYGADGSAPGPATGDLEPYCSGVANHYDIYTAEVGVSYGSGGSHSYVAPGLSSTDNSAFTQAAYQNYTVNHGVGPGAYYFLSGPLWAPSSTSAYQWGVDQAVYATGDFNLANAADEDHHYKLVFLFVMGDIEVDNGDHYYYGWNAPSPTSAERTANQQVFEGFVNFLENSETNVGAYSTPSVFDELMGSSFTDPTVEWTAAGDEGPSTPCPPNSPVDFSSGPGGISAQFWGGVSTSTDDALEWQWAESNLSQGDFDQLDLDNYNNLFGIHDSP
jgi:hypothetical protein